MRNTRTLQLAATTCVAAVAITACGGNGGGGDDDADVTLRMAWWGADYRNTVTEEMIGICEEEAGVSITPDYTDWEGYWDQLATQTGGGDTPDIIQMDDTYLREYADRGILLDLADVDVSAMDEDSIANGQTEDGQMGITTGVNSMAFLANPEVFAEAGMDLPDDTSWTWDEYRQLVIELTEALPDGWYGDGGPVQPADFQIWLRQNGKHLTTDDGDIGFDEADLEEYFEFQLGLIEDGGYPNASLMQEESNAAPGESMFEVGEQALGRWWSNTMPGVSDQAGTDMVMLRWPSATGNSEDNGLWYKSTMLWSGYAGTDHPEETQAVIDCLVNNEEAGRAQGMDRGLPANEQVRDAVVADLEGNDLAVAEWMDEIEPDIEAQDPEPVPAMGASALQDILGRYSEEVYFERMSPAEAAEAVVAEASDAVGE
ncbi:ABC transporter substrate-binding protein [Nesterenkonia alba]|uniref:ABC transporter substrate-binding protein n=1 Tax=Nesterenkonia alba TaxID=515814 RepID=UPI0003B3CDDF|nr:extracellular solute-binding protein [Nesterenkonia alba]